MGWFKGKSTGNHKLSNEIWDFPVIFPANQSIDIGNIQLEGPGISSGIQGFDLAHFPPRHLTGDQQVGGCPRHGALKGRIMENPDQNLPCKRWHNHGNSSLCMGQLTISMAIFHSVSHWQRVHGFTMFHDLLGTCQCMPCECPHGGWGPHVFLLRAELQLQPWHTAVVEEMRPWRYPFFWNHVHPAQLTLKVS